MVQRSITLYCRKLITNIVCLSDRWYTGFLMFLRGITYYTKRGQQIDYGRNIAKTVASINYLYLTPVYHVGSLDQYIGLFLDRLPNGKRERELLFFSWRGNPKKGRCSPIGLVVVKLIHALDTGHRSTVCEPTLLVCDLPLITEAAIICSL